LAEAAALLVLRKKLDTFYGPLCQHSCHSF
jgi:hypothetical protein